MALARGAKRKVGAGLQPRNVLPRVRFHDLRHSAASLLIANGVELVEVSMLLGHSELRVTSDLYAHLQKQTAAKAARGWTLCSAPPARVSDGCQAPRWRRKHAKYLRNMEPAVGLEPTTC